MPNLNELSGVPRRTLHVFFVLDASGSMSGIPIATVNTAMRETIDEIKNQAKHNADALVKVAVLEFNSGCRWVTNEKAPEELEDFMWQKLTAGGLTDMGAALKELNSKLSKDSFLSTMTGAYVPVIIFMTDGYATDNYKDALEQIRKNKWFQHATKIGFAIGSDPDREMLSEIVGNPEAIIATDDLELFAKMLKFVSVTASMVASQSQTSGTAMTGGDIVKVATGDEDTSVLEGYIIDGPDSKFVDVDDNIPDVGDIPDLDDTEWPDFDFD